MKTESDFIQIIHKFITPLLEGSAKVYKTRKIKPQSIRAVADEKGLSGYPCGFLPLIICPQTRQEIACI